MFSIHFEDDHQELPTHPDPLLRSFHRHFRQISQMHQTLNTIGQLNEGTERHELGDAPAQHLPLSHTVGEHRERVGLHRFQR